MLSIRKMVFVGFTLVMALSGCGKEESATDTFFGNDLRGPETQVKSRSNILLNSFKITFEGRTETADSTTFTWTLRGPGSEPALRNFVIQLPDCAPEPLSFIPNNAIVVSSNSDPAFYGVQWTLMTETDHQYARQYSITFPGIVPLGEVHASLTEGNETEVAVVPGPCQGFDISGRVFVDADNDGQLNPEQESGIANVLVELIDSEGSILTMATDQFGVYSFRKLDGTFTISLPLDEDSDYFNSRLAESFVATTSLSREVTVPPDSPHNNFGFNTLHRNIVIDLYNGDLPTDGQTLGYWQEEFRSALFDDHERRAYNGKTLLEMLAEVQSLFLKSNYSFTPGQELQEAYALLSNDSIEPYYKLLAELFATELNHVVGRGLVDQDELQLVLIAWGEGLLAQNPPSDPLVDKGKSNGESGVVLSNPDEVVQANRLFVKVNTGGGGGIDE